jgi:hypothetical protein
MEMPMTSLALLLPVLSLAQAAPVVSPPASTLVILAGGNTPEARDLLQPAVDSLCEHFEDDLGPFKAVIRLKDDPQLGAISSTFTPKADLGADGRFFRTLEQGIQRKNFRTCKSDGAPVELVGKFQLVVFRLLSSAEANLSIQVLLYDVENRGVEERGHPVNAYVASFGPQREALGQCAGLWFWKRPWVEESTCSIIRGNTAPPSVEPGPKPGPAPILLTSPPPPRQPAVYQRWWFWTAIGGALAGGALAIALASRGAPPRPDCPSTWRCGGQ